MSIRAVMDNTKKFSHGDVLFPIILIDRVSGLIAMIDSSGSLSIRGGKYHKEEAAAK